MLKSAKRMQQIAPFYVMDLLAKARSLEKQGQSIIHMEIGEPDLPTPEPIVEAGIKALREGQTHYTPAAGLPALRNTIARYYQEHYAAGIDASNVIITPGSSGALQLVIETLIDPGDEVLLTDPGYPCNKHFVQLAGGQTQFLNLSQANDFNLTLDDIKQHWNDKTKALLVASPANPTGEIIPFDTLISIAQYARERNGFLIIDEIYQGLEYDTKLQTMVGQLDNVFVINSFSKYFCMTGWRIGWLVAPEAFIADIDKLAQNIFLAAPTIAQHAALAAFRPETLMILEKYRIAFQERRDFLYDSLQEMGFVLPRKPRGAFYIYADSQALTDDSYAFCFELLEKAGVAITPGKDFSQNHPENFVRFAYTQDIAMLEKGVNRIKQYLQK